MDHAGPVAEGGQRGARRGHGLDVAIDTENLQVGMGSEKRGRVSPSPDGGVDHEARGHRPEERDDVVDHHGCVGKALAHPQPLDRLGAVGMSPRSAEMEAGGVGIFHHAGREAAQEPRPACEPVIVLVLLLLP